MENNKKESKDELELFNLAREMLKQDEEKLDFDKPLKLSPYIPKMKGAPSDYNEEMEKLDRELERRS